MYRAIGQGERGEEDGTGIKVNKSKITGVKQRSRSKVSVQMRPQCADLSPIKGEQAAAERPQAAESA